PGAGAQDRLARRDQRLDRRSQSEPANELQHNGRFSSREYKAVQPDKIEFRPHFDRIMTELVQRFDVASKGALQRQHADAHHPPREERRSLPGSEEAGPDSIAWPSPAETSATLAISLALATALTIAFARLGASSLRKIPLPTKTDSAPSRIQRTASAGVA